MNSRHNKNLQNIIKDIFIIYTSSYGEYPTKDYINVELKKYLLKKNPIHFINNSSNFSYNNLDFLFIVKNGENYFNHFFPKIYNNIKRNIKGHKFYIYENNSTDQTKNILNNLVEHNIKSIDENIVNNNIFLNVKKYLDDAKLTRYHNILRARNNLMTFYKENILLKKNIDNLKNNWVVLMDIDVVFNFQTIKNLFKKVNEYPDGVMFCCNTKYNNIYYDILALENGMFFNPTGIHELDKVKIFLNRDRELKSTFGGLTIIRKDILLKNNWNKNIPDIAKKYNCYKDNYICEHWQFCQDIRKYGKIYFIKDTDAIWLNDNDYKRSDFNMLKKKYLLKFGLM